MPDDGRGVGGGDRHAGLEAEVGVGGAHEDGHDDAEEHGAERELAGLAVGGYEGAARSGRP